MLRSWLMVGALALIPRSPPAVTTRSPATPARRRARQPRRAPARAAMAVARGAPARRAAAAPAPRAARAAVAAPAAARRRAVTATSRRARTATTATPTRRRLRRRLSRRARLGLHRRAERLQHLVRRRRDCGRRGVRRRQHQRRRRLRCRRASRRLASTAPTRPASARRTAATRSSPGTRPATTATRPPATAATTSASSRPASTAWASRRLHDRLRRQITVAPRPATTATPTRSTAATPLRRRARLDLHHRRPQRVHLDLRRRHRDAGEEGATTANTAAGDGCGATCGVEPGYSAWAPPSSCSSICGDGIVTADRALRRRRHHRRRRVLRPLRPRGGVDLRRLAEQLLHHLRRRRPGGHRGLRRRQPGRRRLLQRDLHGRRPADRAERHPGQRERRHRHRHRRAIATPSSRRRADVDVFSITVPTGTLGTITAETQNGILGTTCASNVIDTVVDIKEREFRQRRHRRQQRRGRLLPGHGDRPRAGRVLHRGRGLLGERDVRLRAADHAYPRRLRQQRPRARGGVRGRQHRQRRRLLGPLRARVRPRERGQRQLGRGERGGAASEAVLRKHHARHRSRLLQLRRSEHGGREDRDLRRHGPGYAHGDNTVLRLYGPNGTTELANDADDGLGLCALIPACSSTPAHGTWPRVRTTSGTRTSSRTPCPRVHNADQAHRALRERHRRGLRGVRRWPGLPGDLRPHPRVR